MMMTKKLMAVALLLLASTAYAADLPGDWQTMNMMNGRWWVKINTDMKQGYVLAVYDEDQIATGGASTKYSELFKLNIGEVSESIDQFYSRPHWRVLPVVNAMFLISHRNATGISESAFEELVADFIKKLNLR